jgi:uncharacterized membrane protein YgaE (UPF0421/DUF939 family)
MIETVLRRSAYSVWPIAQQTAAAVVAWVIALRFAGHPEPFFAPIAAIVGLNVTLGHRGSNAVRLLIAVIVGIAVAELAVEFAGGGVWTLALATFFAMLIARAVDDQPIVVAQAAVGAVLVTTFGNQGQGWERLVDALIGGGVALVLANYCSCPSWCGCSAARKVPCSQVWPTACGALPTLWNTRTTIWPTRQQASCVRCATIWSLSTQYARPAPASCVTP